MEQGRQYGSANHNVRETISGSCPKPLSIRTPTLAVFRTVCCLPDGGHAKDSGSSNRIYGHLERELKFHFGGKRGGILFIRDVEVRHDAQEPLMFLRLELLSRDLHRVVMDVGCRFLCFNPQLNSSHDFELPRSERNAGRLPIRETPGSDGDLARHSRLDIMELEGSTWQRSHGASITVVTASELNSSIGYRITVYIDCRADDDSQTSALVFHSVQTNISELPRSWRSQSRNEFGIGSTWVLILFV